MPLQDHGRLGGGEIVGAGLESALGALPTSVSPECAPFDSLLEGVTFFALPPHRLTRATGALGTYTEKVDWQCFQEKYKGVPADAIV